MMNKTEKPIIFTGEMVQAILIGCKTQSRRVVKDNISETRRGISAGMKLWVRETWLPRAAGTMAIYKANHSEAEAAGLSAMYSDRGWRPSIFMPRRASRITLEVIEVRKERIQDISFEDCLAEGIVHTKFWDKCKGETIADDLAGTNGDIDMDLGWEAYAREAFRDLWNSINEKRGLGWNANPMVSVITFKKLD